MVEVLIDGLTGTGVRRGIEPGGRRGSELLGDLAAELVHLALAPIELALRPVLVLAAGEPQHLDRVGLVDPALEQVDRLPRPLDLLHVDRAAAGPARELVARKADREHDGLFRAALARGVAHVRSFLLSFRSTVATLDSSRPSAPRRQSPLMEDVILTDSLAILFQPFRTTAITSSQ